MLSGMGQRLSEYICEMYKQIRKYYYEDQNTQCAFNVNIHWKDPCPKQPVSTIKQFYILYHC